VLELTEIVNGAGNSDGCVIEVWFGIMVKHAAGGAPSGNGKTPRIISTPVMLIKHRFVQTAMVDF